MYLQPLHAFLSLSPQAIFGVNYVFHVNPIIFLASSEVGGGVYTLKDPQILPRLARFIESRILIPACWDSTLFWVWLGNETQWAHLFFLPLHFFQPPPSQDGVSPSNGAREKAIVPVVPDKLTSEIQSLTGFLGTDRHLSC